MGEMVTSSDQSRDVLYRYDTERYASDWQMDIAYSDYTIKLVLTKYPIIRRTPKGVWIREHSCCDSKKFVLLTARKKYACETEQEALQSFIARKNRQIRILKDQLDTATVALQKAIIMQAERGKVNDDSQRLPVYS